MVSLKPLDTANWRAPSPTNITCFVSSMTFLATETGCLIFCKNATEPAFPVESITQASRVTFPFSSGSPPIPTELFFGSASACLAAFSAASIELPPLFRTLIASSLAARPKSQVDNTTGLFLLIFKFPDLARISGEDNPTKLVRKKFLLFMH